MLKYYKNLLSQEILLPNERSLQRQVEILSLCPFGSDEYKKELINLFEVQLNEGDRDGNKTKLRPKIEALLT